MRCPVLGLIVPKSTRLAFLPVIGTIACSPRNDHALLRTGKRRKMVSSSKSSTAPGGICFNFLMIAPFSGLGSGLSLRRSNEVFYKRDPSPSSAVAVSREQSCTGSVRPDDEQEFQPSRRWSGSRVSRESAAALSESVLRSAQGRQVAFRIVGNLAGSQLDETASNGRPGSKQIGDLIQ